MKTAERTPPEAAFQPRAHREVSHATLAREPAPLAHTFEAISILPRVTAGQSAGETDTNTATQVTSPVPQVVSGQEGRDTAPAGQQQAPAVEAGGAEPAQQQQQPAQPAAQTAPTLAVTPSNTLLRGDTLTATINFTPPTGSTLVVTAWTYTAGRATVTRPSRDATFNTSWSGLMAASGTLDLAYRIDQGATTGTVQHLTQDITVNDRTGAPWESSITENAEVAYAGQPSPPQRFPQLGVHETNGSTLPQVTASPITSGPNQGFTFAGSLTAGSYISQPKIHADLNNPQSAFMVFHQQAGLLFITPSGGARARVNDPALTFTISGGTSDFSVPQWEAFYKRQHFYTITYRQGRYSYTLPDAEWTLASNAVDADIQTTGTADASIRTALHLSATDGYAAPNIATRGNWTVATLLSGPRILSGTQSHEYQHAIHSHRGNYRKMMRALDPQRKSESKVFPPGQAQNYTNLISGWWRQIGNGMASHKLVDEAQSRDQETFVDDGSDMAGVNQNAAGELLGNVWNITGNNPMGN
jgi:hypothetical protein